ncbi:MAG: leucine-rich repeat domain-containing protein [Alphaproteobacteria bacterium]|nr:leucine-rich repeat domain-containing protein [Alphaproteobacteria bacterium]
MKHLRFIGFFTLMFVNPVLAETVSCTNGVREDGITACDKCGDNCDWSFDTVSGALTVSGSGNMNDYAHYEEEKTYYTTAPWGKYQGQIKSIDVSGLSNIGVHAFSDLGSQLNNVNISDSVTYIKKFAFWADNSLSSIDLPDSLVSIGDGAFAWDRLTKIIIPDTLQTFGSRNLGYYAEANRDAVEIICRGNNESCKKLNSLLEQYVYFTERYDANGKAIYSKKDISNRMTLAQAEDCSSLNYFWNGVECVREPDVSKRACCPVCADLDGFCSRIRYTLPEADAATSDDNENMIEWIFE